MFVSNTVVDKLKLHICHRMVSTGNMQISENEQLNTEI